MMLFIAVALAAYPPSMSDFRPGGASNWMYRATTDPMTDKIVSSATVESDDGTASLKVKCDSAINQVVSIQYRTTGYLGSGDRMVSLRFDKQPPVNSQWETSDRIVYERDVIQVANLVRAMELSEKLMIRAFDFEKRTHDATFSINGRQSTPVWQQVFQDCGYPNPLLQNPAKR